MCAYSAKRVNLQTVKVCYHGEYQFLTCFRLNTSAIKS